MMAEKVIYIFQDNSTSGELYLAVGDTPGVAIYNATTLFGAGIHYLGSVEDCAELAGKAQGKVRVRGASVIAERRKARKVFYCKQCGHAIMPESYYWSIILTFSGLTGLKYPDRVCLQHLGYMARYNKDLTAKT